MNKVWWVVAALIVVPIGIIAVLPDAEERARDEWCDPDFKFVEGDWPVGHRVVICEEQKPKLWPYKVPSAGFECVRPEGYFPCPIVHVAGNAYPLNGVAKMCNERFGWGLKEQPFGPDTHIRKWEPVYGPDGEELLVNGLPAGGMAVEVPAWELKEKLGC